MITAGEEGRGGPGETLHRETLWEFTEEEIEVGGGIGGAVFEEGGLGEEGLVEGVEEDVKKVERVVELVLVSYWLCSGSSFSEEVKRSVKGSCG